MQKTKCDIVFIQDKTFVRLPIDIYNKEEYEKQRSICEDTEPDFTPSEELVNVDSIVSVMKDGDRCTISLVNGREFTVNVSYEELIKELEKI